MLSGVHVGCFELFANNGIRKVRELKGKSIGIGVIGGSAQMFLVRSEPRSVSMFGRYGHPHANAGATRLVGDPEEFLGRDRSATMYRSWRRG